MNEPRDIWRSTLLLHVGHFLSGGFLDSLHRFEHAAFVALVFVDWHCKTETADCYFELRYTLGNHQTLRSQPNEPFFAFDSPHPVSNRRFDLLIGVSADVSLDVPPAGKRCPRLSFDRTRARDRQRKRAAAPARYLLLARYVQ